MTTGEFRSVPIDIIWVNQDERQRSKLDGVDSGGFINPPLITRDYRRICGEQRVEAAKQRGHTAIVCQITHVTDPTELRVLQLEENTVRTNVVGGRKAHGREVAQSLLRASKSAWGEMESG